MAVVIGTPWHGGSPVHRAQTIGFPEYGGGPRGPAPVRFARSAGAIISENWRDARPGAAFRAAAEEKSRP